MIQYNLKVWQIKWEQKKITFKLYMLSESNTNSSSSLIAPISIALSKAPKPPSSLIDARAPLKWIFQDTPMLND